MSALADTKSALSAAQALLDDARKREGKASDKRAADDATLARASAIHGAAVSKSAADPDNDRLLDDVTRLALKVQHARKALGDSTTAHEAVTREVRDAEARVEAAKCAVERAVLEQELKGPSFDDEVSSAATEMVAAVQSLEQALGRIRAAMQTDKTKVERYQQLGGVMTVRDGTAPAAYLARALLSAGAQRGCGEHRLRHLLELPQYSSYPLPVGETAGALIDVLCRRGEPSPYGLTQLQRQASMTGARTLVEFDDAERARERPTPPHLREGTAAAREAAIIASWGPPRPSGVVHLPDRLRPPR